MEVFHGTTILCVRRDGTVALGGDGQVTLGNVVIKATARKVRRIYHDRVLAGFAGATADAFTLFERFEAKLEKHQGHLTRSAVELAKDWRSDRVLRRLEAMLAIADHTASLVITGNGDVLEPEHGIVAIGSGGAFAQAAARALLEHSTLAAEDIVKQALTIAGELCIYTNQHHVIEVLPGTIGAMTAQCFDVVVAGAGLVGLSLAPALARSGLSVALVDRAAIAAPESDPDSWDARIYAISPGSASFLRALGAWQLLPAERIAAIERMQVEGDAGGRFEFSAYDMGERALAWIVEERALRTALLPASHAAGVAMFGQSSCEAIDWTADDAVLDLGRADTADRIRLRARLVVGADGLRSWTRQAAGIVAEPRPYGQTAVVANFACERAHHGIARQWFRTDGGVLAWLPLPGRRISIVWSAPEALAGELIDLSAEALAMRVATAGGDALGALELLGTPAAFPLALLKLPTTIAHRLALVGDAAHGVHPLAGQGVNLGFGDAQALARVLAERGPVG